MGTTPKYIPCQLEGMSTPNDNAELTSGRVQLQIHCERCDESWTINRDDLDVAHCPVCDGDLWENYEEYSGQGYDFRKGATRGDGQ